MSLEPCPFCGKPFKRLKSHLPHCKKASASKTSKSSKATKASSPATPKDTTPTDSAKNILNVFDKKLNDLSSKAKPKSKMKVEKEGVDELLVTTVLLAERRITDTGKTKSKWLAKREQEIAKQAVLLKHKGSKLTSDNQQKYNSQPESSHLKVHIKGTTQTERKNAQGQNQKPLKGTTLTSASKLDITAHDLSQDPWIMYKHKANGNILEEIQNSPKALSNIALAPRVKELACFRLFQTKTCVWDHIKHGLYDRASGVMPVLYSKGATQDMSVSKLGNISVSVHKPHLENQNALTTASFAPWLACGQTSFQRQVDDMCMSTLQSKTVTEGTPEMGMRYGEKLVSEFRSEIPSQSSKPPPQSQVPGTEQRLGDVRLCEFAAWLGARTPTSPKEAVTMLNRGGQWYYRKYINVQKGGMGGIAMLLAGYCVLSYIWNYPHLRKERWRKYH